MTDIKFKAKVWKWTNSFIVTVPMSYIDNNLLAEGKTYEFSVKEVIDSKTPIKIVCSVCKGFDERPSKDHVIAVENGLYCNCGGKLEVIYDDA